MPRSTCAGCGKVFNSTSGFEMHRMGEFEVIEPLPNGRERRRSNRHCRTTEEMLAIGMILKETGRWATSEYDPSIHHNSAEAAD